MFRVLTEKEAENAIRWKAPELASKSTTVAKTSQWTSPIIPSVAEPRKTADPITLSGDDLAEPLTSAPRLQVAHRDSFAGVTDVAAANPSVDSVQASYDDGYARGYAEGNAALHQQAVKELNTIIDAISRSTVDSGDTALQQEVVGLSIDIARILLARELVVDDSAMLQLVKAGLEQLPSMAVGSKRIHLHPLDANTVREQVTNVEDIVVVDDPALRRGDCRITTSNSTLHCGVDQWLEGIAKQLGLSADLSMGKSNAELQPTS